MAQQVQAWLSLNGKIYPNQEQAVAADTEVTAAQNIETVIEQLPQTSLFIDNGLTLAMPLRQLLQKHIKAGGTLLGDVSDAVAGILQQAP